MIIERIETVPLRVPLKRPFETSFGRFTSRELLYVRVLTSVGETTSECPVFGPYYSYETVTTACHVIEDHLAPRLIGADIKSAEEYVDRVAEIRGHPMAKSALEHAIWDLLAQQAGQPLHRFLGGVKTEVPVGVSLGVQSRIGELLELIEVSLERGYRRVKIKIHPGWDRDVVERVRDRFPDIPLMVDANAAYSLEDLRLFKALDAHDLLMIEQPLHHADLVQHSALQKQLRTPICLDESVKGIADVEAAQAMGSCRIVNIKPFRVGGLHETVRIERYCVEHGLHVWCGGMVETGLGRAINLAAAALEGFDQVNDIAPTLDRFVEDAIAPPLEMSDAGTIRLSERPGLGYALQEAFVETYRIR